MNCALKLLLFYVGWVGFAFGQAPTMVPTQTPTNPTSQPTSQPSVPTSMPTNLLQTQVIYDVTMVMFNVTSSFMALSSSKSALKSTISSIMIGVDTDDITIPGISNYIPSRRLLDSTDASVNWFTKFGAKHVFLPDISTYNWMGPSLSPEPQIVTYPDCIVNWNAVYISEVLSYSSVGASIYRMSTLLNNKVNDGTFAATFASYSGNPNPYVNVTKIAMDVQINTSIIHSAFPSSSPTPVPSVKAAFLSQLEIIVLVIIVVVFWCCLGALFATYYHVNGHSINHKVKRPHEKLTVKGQSVRNFGEVMSPNDRMNSSNEGNFSPTSSQSQGFDFRRSYSSLLRGDLEEGHPSKIELTDLRNMDDSSSSTFKESNHSNREVNNKIDTASMSQHEILMQCFDELEKLSNLPKKLKSKVLVPSINSNSNSEVPHAEWPGLEDTCVWVEQLVSEYQTMCKFRDYCRILFDLPSSSEYNQRFKMDCINVLYMQLDPTVTKNGPSIDSIVMHLLGYESDISKLRLYGNGLVKETKNLYSVIISYGKKLLHMIEQLQEKIEDSSMRPEIRNVDSQMLRKPSMQPEHNVRRSMSNVPVSDAVEEDVKEVQKMLRKPSMQPEHNVRRSMSNVPVSDAVEEKYVSSYEQNTEQYPVPVRAIKPISLASNSAPPKIPETLETYSEAWEHKADANAMPSTSSTPIPTSIPPHLIVHLDDTGDVSSLDTGYSSSNAGNASLKRERSIRSKKSKETKSPKLKKQKSREKQMGDSASITSASLPPDINMTPKRNLRDLIAKSASGLTLDESTNSSNAPIQKPGRRSSLSAVLDSSQAIREQKANAITNRDNKMLSPVTPVIKHKKIDVASAADRWKSLIKK